MKKVVKIINGIAVAVMVISGLCLDSSDIAIRLCLISTVYLTLYNMRWSIAKAAYKAVRFYMDALKEAKAQAKR